MAAPAAAMLLFLLAAFLTAGTALPPSTPASPAALTASPTQNSNTDFILRSCNSTRYPSLCYTSLAGYAAAVAHDPTRLALAAANVSLAKTQAASSYVSSVLLTAGSAANGRAAAALRDCAETLGDAVDLTRRAAGEIRKLPAAAGAEVAWLVSNAQTWLSAAMSNEETCVDGLEWVAAGGGGGAPAEQAVTEEVRRRVELVEKYTSNALALVNRLVGQNR